MQAYCIPVASDFVFRPQIWILSMLKNGESFPILIANKIVHVTVLLVIYFFNQCKSFENQLRFDKITQSLKVGTFLRHSVDSRV